LPEALHFNDPVNIYFKRANPFNRIIHLLRPFNVEKHSIECKDCNVGDEREYEISFTLPHSFSFFERSQVFMVMELEKQEKQIVIRELNGMPIFIERKPYNIDFRCFGISKNGRNEDDTVTARYSKSSASSGKTEENDSLEVCESDNSYVRPEIHNREYSSGSYKDEWIGIQRNRQFYCRPLKRSAPKSSASNRKTEENDSLQFSENDNSYVRSEIDNGDYSSEWIGVQRNRHCSCRPPKPMRCFSAPEYGPDELNEIQRKTRCNYRQKSHEDWDCPSGWNDYQQRFMLGDSKFNGLNGKREPSLSFNRANRPEDGSNSIESSDTYWNVDKLYLDKGSEDSLSPGSAEEFDRSLSPGKATKSEEESNEEKIGDIGIPQNLPEDSDLFFANDRDLSIMKWSDNASNQNENEEIFFDAIDTEI
jgi:hypothetical protein